MFRFVCLILNLKANVSLYMCVVSVFCFVVVDFLFCLFLLFLLFSKCISFSLYVSSFFIYNVYYISIIKKLCLQQRHFEFQPAPVVVEGRSNVVLNMHVRLQISLLMRFLSLLHKSSQCAFGNGMCYVLLIQQFFKVFASLKV